MSERQAKCLRALEARETALTDAVEDHSVRLTACEASVNWMLAHEEAMYGAAMESTRKHLRRARRIAHDWEETAWRWKAIATTAIAVLTVVVFGIIVL